MLNRLEMSGQAMITRMAQLEVLTNNVANVSTTGYKRDESFFQSVKRKELDLGTRPEPRDFPVADARIDLSQGSLSQTNRPFDLALSGQGFFTVEAPTGEAFTRNGQFTLNRDNLLVTVDGFPVLGEGGPIEINLEQNAANELLINESGEIFLDGSLIDKLQIVTVTDPNDLEKKGQNLFHLKPGRGPALPVEAPSVKQGFLEDANVDAVAEMVAMLEVLQQFEMGQRLARTEDDLLHQAATQVGRVS